MRKKVWKILLLIICFIILFSFVTTIFGLLIYNNGDPHIVFSNPDLGEPKLLDCLYFSIITFFTIGYGDLYPITRSAQFFVSFEGLVGQISGFVFSGLLIFYLFKPINKVLIADKAVVVNDDKGFRLKMRFGSKSTTLYNVVVKLTLQSVNNGVKTHFFTDSKEYLSIKNTWFINYNLNEEKYLALRQNLLRVHKEDNEIIFMTLNIIGYDEEGNIHYKVQDYTRDDLYFNYKFYGVRKFVEDGNKHKSEKRPWSNFNKVYKLNLDGTVHPINDES